ncbi:hypothetical protein [Blautia sp. MSJ-19]|uniref:hypothetical protein n=1 Tax=Blautia sp. MSJ-19 TaxID=2841517 RepID=UPI001C0EA4F4|nr:hypothetical protein [Blautia sp. MSJ-19]MBU5480519.1 hypothetical protein [Blautia sp. MSJ-19]
MNKKEQKNPVKSRLYTSILLLLMAFVAVTAATVAWFSIADRAKVKTMSLDIIADADLRMDLDPHRTIDQYVKTLSFEQIAARIQQEKGFSMETTPLEPVTTSDQETFTYEDGRTVENTSGAYLEFTLHFMAAKDMIVHLTSGDSSSGAGDGTAVTSQNSALPEAMRISFAADGTTWIFDPGMGSGSSTQGSARTFGLPDASAMKINDDNAMFSLKEGVDKEVKVHIWMEGTDPACTDELRGSDYSIRLRFTGDKTEDEET